jgi:hypothetical protein
MAEKQQSSGQLNSAMAHYLACYGSIDFPREAEIKAAGIYNGDRYITDLLTEKAEITRDPAKLEETLLNIEMVYAKKAGDVDKVMRMMRQRFNTPEFEYAEAVSMLGRGVDPVKLKPWLKSRVLSPSITEAFIDKNNLAVFQTMVAHGIGFSYTDSTGQSLADYAVAVKASPELIEFLQLHTGQNAAPSE